MKYTFCYNVNQHKLFATINANFDSYSSGTNYSTKFIASYILENSTYQMVDPTAGELIDMDSIPSNTFDGVSLVYINSVTYGRLDYCYLNVTIIVIR